MKRCALVLGLILAAMVAAPSLSSAACQETFTGSKVRTGTSTVGQQKCTDSSPGLNWVSYTHILITSLDNPLLPGSGPGTTGGSHIALSLDATQPPDAVALRIWDQRVGAAPAIEYVNVPETYRGGLIWFGNDDFGIRSDRDIMFQAGTDMFYYRAHTGASPFLGITPHQLHFWPGGETQPPVLQFEQNNVGIMLQLDAAGTNYVYPIWVDNHDRVSLASHPSGSPLPAPGGQFSSEATDIAEGQTSLLLVTRQGGILSQKRVIVDVNGYLKVQ